MTSASGSCAFGVPMPCAHGSGYLLMTPQLAGISRAELGPQAGNLIAEQRLIATAIEFLMRGF